MREFITFFNVIFIIILIIIIIVALTAENSFMLSDKKVIGFSLLGIIYLALSIFGLHEDN